MSQIKLTNIDASFDGVPEGFLENADSEHYLPDLQEEFTPRDIKVRHQLSPTDTERTLLIHISGDFNTLTISATSPSKKPIELFKDNIDSIINPKKMDDAVLILNAYIGAKPGKKHHVDGARTATHTTLTNAVAAAFYDRRTQVPRMNQAEVRKIAGLIRAVKHAQFNAS